MAGLVPFPIARIKHEDGECLLYAGKSARIGRSSESDLVINDPKVSRNHALVEWDGSGFTIRDLGSSNGTAVGGRQLQDAPCRLKDGDQITIHTQTLIFEIIHVGVTAPLLDPCLEGSEPPGSPKGPRLLVRAGPDTGQEYILWGDRVTLGRASREASWEIRLSDRAVSRPHACVQREGESFQLIDLGSANGTLLNGLALNAPTTLTHGDIILLGETELVFYW